MVPPVVAKMKHQYKTIEVRCVEDKTDFPLE